MTEESCPKPSEESMAAVNASRQRKKRKWDQPAESLLSAVLAVPGALPMGMGGLVGITLPGANPLSGALLKNQAPATCATASQLIQAHAISQNAAAIVQKLNQPKVQDEQIAREIVINDAEPTVRYKLTKRQTQEEIQKCTGAVVITRGKYRPPNGLPDNEKPLYLHISAGAHLKDMAERIKAVDRAASMVEEILKHSQNSMPASTPFHSVLSNGQVTQPLSTCLFLGFDTDPSLNIAARIRGPNDQYINHIMNETGATVVLRGRGSGNIESFLTEEVQQPLHLYLSSTNAKSLEDAKILAENLLDTICVECGASRISSCKVYSAVPPPQQLLVGVQSYAKELAGSACTTIGSMPATPTFAPSGVPVSSGSNICPPGAGVQTAALFNYENSASNISFPSRSSTGGTSYNGYGGIYPQATPLQQVALALRQAPTSTSSILASTTSSTSTLPNAASSSSVEREKRKRKFQELPVASKGPTTFQNLRQGSEFLKPGSEDSSVKNVSCMPPPKKLVQPGSDGMPPPPPRNVPLPLHSRIIPPPPPKFSSPKSPPKAENGKSDQKKSRTEPVSGTDMENKSVLEKRSANPVSETLLKLVEYGEEDEEDIDGTGEESSTSNPMRSMTVKPFWAL